MVLEAVVAADTCSTACWPALQPVCSHSIVASAAEQQSTALAAALGGIITTSICSSICSPWQPHLQVQGGHVHLVRLALHDAHPRAQPRGRAACQPQVPQCEHLATWQPALLDTLDDAC
jgi:hypothetical protein